jgi:flagellar motor protein MotB
MNYKFTAALISILILISILYLLIRYSRETFQLNNAHTETILTFFENLEKKRGVFYIDGKPIKPQQQQQPQQQQRPRPQQQQPQQQQQQQQQPQPQQQQQPQQQPSAAAEAPLKQKLDSCTNNSQCIEGHTCRKCGYPGQSGQGRCLTQGDCESANRVDCGKINTGAAGPMAGNKNNYFEGITACQCKDKCDNYPENLCKAWHHYTNSKQCWLKNKVDLDYNGHGVGAAATAIDQAPPTKTYTYYMYGPWINNNIQHRTAVLAPKSVIVDGIDNNVYIIKDKQYIKMVAIPSGVAKYINTNTTLTNFQNTFSQDNWNDAIIAISGGEYTYKLGTQWEKWTHPTDGGSNIVRYNQNNRVECASDKPGACYWNTHTVDQVNNMDKNTLISNMCGDDQYLPGHWCGMYDQANKKIHIS